MATRKKVSDQPESAGTPIQQLRAAIEVARAMQKNIDALYDAWQPILPIKRGIKGESIHLITAPPPECPFADFTLPGGQELLTDDTKYRMEELKSKLTGIKEAFDSGPAAILGYEHLLRPENGPKTEEALTRFIDGVKRSCETVRTYRKETLVPFMAWYNETGPDNKTNLEKIQASFKTSMDKWVVPDDMAAKYRTSPNVSRIWEQELRNVAPDLRRNLSDDDRAMVRAKLTEDAVYCQNLRSAVDLCVAHAREAYNDWNVEGWKIRNSVQRQQAEATRQRLDKATKGTSTARPR